MRHMTTWERFKGAVGYPEGLDTCKYSNKESYNPCDRLCNTKS